MSLRLSRLLLVILLVVGQVGGWLHAVGHYADGPVATDLHGDGDSSDGEFGEAPCLVCLSYAALALALLPAGLFLATCFSSFRRPLFEHRDRRTCRVCIRRARGPPAYS